MIAATRRDDDRTVWILVHELTRTGVPVVLCRYLRSLSPACRRRVLVIAHRGGPLVDVVSSLGVEVVVIAPIDRRTSIEAVRAGLAVCGWPRMARSLRRAELRIRMRGRRDPEVVVVHGAGGIPLLSVAPASVPVVLHLHELRTGLVRSAASSELSDALRRASIVMAVSSPVADLALESGIPAQNVIEVPGVIDQDSPRPRDGARERLSTIGVLRDDPGSPVVAGAGTPGWRKGTDRLAAISHQLRREGVRPEVLWVGGKPSGGDRDWLGAEDPVHWSVDQADPWSLLAGADVIVVPSREDPMPLIALEAGHHGLPVVATATGGLPSLLAEGRGHVVGCHDLPGLAAGVADVLGDPSAAADVGSALRRHVELRYRPAVVVPDWWSVVVRVAGGRA